MSRPRGSIIGAKPTWTTTATSGIWALRQAEEMQADGKWPRGPVAPTSLAGSPGDGQVALTWTAPATTHGTITDYVVEYTPAAGSPTVVATGSTAASYTLTGLTNDTEYTFRVAAVNHTRGDYSATATQTPVAGTPPNAPTSLTATAGNAQLSLSWTAPSAPGTSAITGYVVEYTPSGGSASTVNTNSTSTSYTLTGLTNGTAYTFRVAAVNHTRGDYSATALGTPTAFSPTTVILTTGTSYAVPAGASSATVWAVGGGGGGDYDPGKTGGSGATAKKVFNVTAGGTISYAVGSGGLTFVNNGYQNNSNNNGGSTSVTYGGQTLTAGGGFYIGQSSGAATFSGADSGTNGALHITGTFQTGPQAPNHAGLSGDLGTTNYNYGRGGNSGSGSAGGGPSGPSNGSAGVVVITFA